VYGGNLDSKDIVSDGSVIKALSGLHTLVRELAVNSGVDTSLTNWVDSVFGRWKNIMITVLWARKKQMGWGL
jgi:hypothetical protein